MLSFAVAPLQVAVVLCLSQLVAPEVTPISLGAFTEHLSTKSDDPLVVLFYVKWASSGVDALRAVLDEATGAVTAAEMDVSDFGASHSTFRFTEAHHIEEVPSIFLYVDGFQYRYTGGADAAALKKFIGGDYLSSGEKQAAQMDSNEKIKALYEKRDKTDAVDSLPSLTRFNFDSELGDGSDWLVYFFLPLRHESTALFSPLRKAAKVFEEEGLDVKVAQVHMGEQTVADWAGVTKAPSLILFSEGKIYEYPGLTASRLLKDPPRVLDLLSFVDGGFAMTQPRVPGQQKVSPISSDSGATSSDSATNEIPSDLKLRLLELSADMTDFMNDLTRDVAILYRQERGVLYAVSGASFMCGAAFAFSRFRSLLKGS